MSIASDAGREAEVAESLDLRGTHTHRNYQPPTLNSDPVTIPNTHLHEFLAPFDRCSASPCAHNLWGFGLVWGFWLLVGRGGAVVLVLRWGFEGCGYGLGGCDGGLGRMVRGMEFEGGGGRGWW